MSDSKISQLPAYTGGTNADEIPIANLTTQATQQLTLTALKSLMQSGLYAPSATSGSTTHVDTSTTTTTIAHGLGRTPVLCTFRAFTNINYWDLGSFTSGVNQSTMFVAGTTTGSSTYGVYIGNDATNGVGGVVSVDATNITITWTQTGSGGGGSTWTIQWTAI